MAKLYLFVVISLLYSLANGQFRLQPEKTRLVGELGGKLTLTWNMLNIPAGNEVIVAKVYMDDDDLNKRLFNAPEAPRPLQYAEKIFGDRISATITKTPPKYEVTITKLQYNDTGSFSLNVLINDNSSSKDTKKIIISRVEDPKKPGGGGPEKGSNTGAIVGGVIGGIVFIVLIVLGVLYFLRWKKNRGSSEETTKKLNSGNQTYEAPQYADTSVALGNDRQAPAKEYLELGPGGGRVGERTNPPQSHYREVKNLDDDDEEPPQKPERGVFRQDSDGNTISEDINV